MNAYPDGVENYRYYIVVTTKYFKSYCVCGGVTIGEGSVIGAGSVVTRSIPPHSLAVGNPCRVIRELTDADRM